MDSVCPNARDMYSYNSRLGLALLEALFYTVALETILGFARRDSKPFTLAYAPSRIVGKI